MLASVELGGAPVVRLRSADNLREVKAKGVEGRGRITVEMAFGLIPLRCGPTATVDAAFKAGDLGFGCFASRCHTNHWQGPLTKRRIQYYARATLLSLAVCRWHPPSTSPQSLVPPSPGQPVR
jgi:hypothetical protein